MALYAIADLHLPLGIDKPMNIFGSVWDNYVERLADNWQSIVKKNDTVVLPGDFSWATYLEQSVKDFEFLNRLNGKKIMLKGNHDYWWSTLNKLNKFAAEHGFINIQFMQNNCFMYKDTAICGSRGWIHPSWEGFKKEDEAIFKREVIRAELSVEQAGDCEDIIFVSHYPIRSSKLEENDLTRMLKSHNVKEVVYGHLHGGAHKYAVNGFRDGMEYRLVSADYVGFMPQRLRD